MKNQSSEPNEAVQTKIGKDDYRDFHAAFVLLGCIMLIALVYWGSRILTHIESQVPDYSATEGLFAGF